MNRNRNTSSNRKTSNWGFGQNADEGRDFERDYNRNRYGSNTFQRDFTSENDFNSSHRDRDYDRFNRGGSSGETFTDSEWRSSRGNYDYDRNFSHGRQGGDRNRMSSGHDYDQNIGYGYGPDQRNSSWDQDREYEGGGNRFERADYSGMQGSDDYQTRRAFNGGISGGIGDMKRTQDRGFFGKGPKGWKRSDDRIKDEACEALNDSYAVDASDIDVSVKEGMVTLKGNVDTREAKREAERCVEGVRGVIDVQNEIRVKKSENISDIRKTGTDSNRSANLS